MVKNEFFKQLENAYEQNASVDDLNKLLGRGRAKKGMFEGDIVEGELEIGQISGLINEIIPAKQVVEEIVTEFTNALKEQNSPKFQF